MAQHGLTARAHDRILKVARTIATWKEENRSSPSTSPRPSSTVPSIARSGLKTKEWRTVVLARLASKHYPAHRSDDAKPFNISILKSTIGAVYAKLQLSNGHFV
jgi:hypothetical protein